MYANSAESPRRRTVWPSSAFPFIAATTRRKAASELLRYIHGVYVGNLGIIATHFKDEQYAQYQRLGLAYVSWRH